MWRFRDGAEPICNNSGGLPGRAATPCGRNGAACRSSATAHAAALGWLVPAAYALVGHAEVTRTRNFDVHVMSDSVPLAAGFDKVTSIVMVIDIPDPSGWSAR